MDPSAGAEHEPGTTPTPAPQHRDGAVHGSAPGAPSDNTTLTEVLAYFEAAGFAGQAGVTDDGEVHCFSCGAESAPARVSVHSIRRLEGASDPADMVGALALTCPACRVGATLVLKYGPEASEGETRMWLELRDRRDDARAPGAMAPGEDEPGEPDLPHERAFEAGPTAERPAPGR